MNKYITVSEFAERIGLSNSETYKFLSNNFSVYLKSENNIICVDERLLNYFLNVDLDNNKYKIECEELKNQIKEKNDLIIELQTKLNEYTERAFNIAESALNVQQQLNYITANRETKKQGFFKRLLDRKKSID